MSLGNSITTFKNALADALVGARGAPGIKVEAVDQITSNLRRVTDGGSELVCGDSQFPSSVAQHLERAIELASLSDTDGSKAVLIDAFQRMVPWLPWYSRKNARQQCFEDGHANAEILGGQGIERRSDVTVGVTVIAPNLTYPDHHHPPEEVYLVLSQGSWRQDANPWQAPGFAGYIYNPPNIVHAMKSAETPLLAIWCLNPMAA
ncbi:MAG: hypothetical protein CBB68_13940 [Rhodospirillaceae bacterium TMED8]|nr:hypothetical protein [Magnetovibrio sp.]OUT48062.1 MAG: hypothetical protein CBB68_13940 [Rhodospirillaceae bacterium TMED8]|tara:strand:+ start:4236 stop:4850 length:615 start_codon:yes stop_codon:yes gene_type:complete